MCRITEGKLEFTFPENWQAIKLDDTGFYRKHFQNFADSKSMDIASFQNEGDELWLLEIKDYRMDRRTKTSDIFKEVAIKVRDTLALLYLAKGKSETAIHSFAQKAVAKSKIRIVLHLEQPAKHSKLYPAIVERNNAQMKLTQTVRVVDPHPLFCELSAMPATCCWQVIPKPNF
ncbi:MAG: hypothetical protein WCI11_12150 [Candidatus Methylumidiphilus sp.]